MTPQLYTLKDAARCLALSLRTVRKYVDLRHIAVVRLGRNVRISQAELERLVRDGLPEQY